MSSTLLTLRVRGPKDMVTISISSDKTFGELKELIESKLSLDLSKDYVIFGGFPPKSIELDDDEQLSGHITNQDNLRVQYSELSGQQKMGISKKGKAKTVPTTSKTPAMVPFSGRVAGLKPPPKPPVKNKGTRKSSSSTRRLSASDTASSEADISEHLIEAVNGGTGKRNKILRKVFRDAVEYQYNSAKAVSRLQSVYSGQYTIKEDLQSRILNSGQATKINITFHRGLGSRTFFTETVDLLSDEVLLELMKLALQDSEGSGREVLKPMNLSKCSPRIFWSLVYRHGANLIDTIKTMLKDVDSCDWLTERKRELSEKARENLRQKQLEDEAKQARKRRKVSKDKDVAIDLTEREGEKEGNSTSNSALITPAASLSLNAVKVLQFLERIPFQPLLPEPYNTFLSQYFSSPSSSSSSSSSALLSLASFNLTDLSDLSNAFVKQQSQAKSIYEEQVESWIEIAQRKILYIFWNQICGGGSERLAKALQRLRIRTPSELIVWKSAPEGLLQGLLAIDPSLDKIRYYLHPSLSVTSETLETTDTLNKETLSALIDYSSEALALLPWLKSLEEVVVEELREEERARAQEGEEHVEADWSEDWQKEPSAHEWISVRCRVIVRSELQDNDEDEGEEGDDENEERAEKKKEYKTMMEVMMSGCYWEDGHCVAYLPPTDEEPMALWRVQLDPNPKKVVKNSSSSLSTTSDERYEDMERDEIEQAMKLFLAAE
eukprot:gene9607-10431_t